ncbi:MAG: hypothetical protein F4120_11680 [Rhodothermaceae bacterium]|nr:hypothetical protein [Rhodothermaceae bacterium]MYC03510.1 hypothetical protein [Rhodothermaceae bacterium]MYE63919.1 hypothetical protein [Rhodothermaceae bacterium]MYI18258.1 hypothetical protein [Rhodothermaceae bacterium]
MTPDRARLRYISKLSQAWGTAKELLIIAPTGIGTFILLALSIVSGLVQLAWNIIRFLWWCVWTVLVFGAVWLWINEPQILHGLLDWVQGVFGQY